MNQASQLLAQCAASPEFDAPRLAWADLVGGERGELVVIQCDLARGGFSPREVAIRRQRERELLDRHAVAWAGDVARIAKRWTFHRGFVEAAHVASSQLDVAVLEASPLIKALTIEQIDRELPPALGRYCPTLQGLALAKPQHADAKTACRALLSWRMPALRALSIDGIDSELYPSVLALLRSAPIEQLRLRGHEKHLLPALLAAAPKLATLELDRSVPLGLVMNRPLRALRTGNVRARERDTLERCAAAETLEHLRLAAMPGVIGALARFSRLRTLELGGQREQVCATAAELVNTKLPALRRLSLAPGAAFRDVYLIAERFGPQLEELVVPSPETLEEAAVYDSLAERIAGELRVVPEYMDAKFGPELLHASASTMFQLGRPSCALAAPATLVRVDRPGPRFEIPALPAGERVVIGRSPEADIRIVDPTLARQHAALIWRDNDHYIVDLGSHCGIWVNANKNSVEPLRDGHRITVGQLRLDYYRGAAPKSAP